MPTFQASADAQLHYLIDDFTDPWSEPDTILLLHGNAESVPYPDNSFDIAMSEYGACLWADPYKWIPEAARLLRPGRGGRPAPGRGTPDPGPRPIRASSARRPRLRLSRS